jgi:starch phosphorylase
MVQKPPGFVPRLSPASLECLRRKLRGSLADADLDPDTPILGFARRMTGYKRPLLLFEDPGRLTVLAKQYPFQVVMAGKAHPRDEGGKEAIRPAALAVTGSLPSSDLRVSAELRHADRPLIDV